MSRTLGFALMFLSVSAHAFAAASVPEIDPGSAVSAVALLSGGFIVLRAGRRRR